MQPPPILNPDLTIPSLDKSEDETGRGKDGDAAEDEGPSLMEQMMAEAEDDRKQKEAVARKEEQKRLKKFGGGLKGGFFSKPKGKGKGKVKGKGNGKGKGAKDSKAGGGEAKGKEDVVYELGADGEMIPTITKKEVRC